MLGNLSAIHEFNTGRMYTPEGQAIRWRITETLPGMCGTEVHTVQFFDRSRGISGEVTVSTWSGPDIYDIETGILAAYDNGEYRAGTWFGEA